MKPGDPDAQSGLERAKADMLKRQAEAARTAAETDSTPPEAERPALVGARNGASLASAASAASAGTEGGTDIDTEVPGGRPLQPKRRRSPPKRAPTAPVRVTATLSGHRATMPEPGVDR